MNSGFSDSNFKSYFLGYFHTVARFSMAYVDDESEGQDIAQETFIRLYQAWDSFESEEQARSFMYTTCRNLCISRLRHQMLEEQYLSADLDEPTSEDPDERFLSEVTYQETVRLLRKAVDALPQQSRQIILLSLKEKSNAEIAEQLGVSVNTVKSLKKSAYKALRQSLGEMPVKMLVLLLLTGLHDGTFSEWMGL